MLDNEDQIRHSDMLLGVMVHTLSERLGGGWCPTCLERLKTEIELYQHVNAQLAKEVSDETRH